MYPVLSDLLLVIMKSKIDSYDVYVTLYCLNCSSSAKTAEGSGCCARRCWLSAAVAAAASRFA